MPEMRHVFALRALLMVLFLFAARTSRCAVKWYFLKNSCTVGTGFIASDWTGKSPSGVLLVTAAHVLGGCGETLVYKDSSDISAPTDLSIHSFKADHAVLLWHQLDIAALPLAAGEAGKLGHATAIKFVDGLSADGQSLTIYGFSATANVHIGFLEQIISITKHAVNLKYLGPRTNMSVDQMVGSLDGNWPLAVYLADAMGGTSGGPVTFKDDPDHIIGVHNGGFQAGINSWAVLFRRDMPQPHKTQLSGDWQLFHAPFMGQALPSRGDDFAALVNHVRDTAILTPSLVGDTDFKGSWMGGVGLSLFRALVNNWPEDSGRFSFGGTIEGDFEGGEYLQKLQVPDGNTIQERSMPRLEFAGNGLFEFRGFLWRHWWSASTGIRLGKTRFESPVDGKTDWHVIAGAPLQLSFPYVQLTRWLFSVRLGATYWFERPSQNYQYSGAGGKLNEAAGSFPVTFTGGVDFAFTM